ncbi:MAG: DUF1292 domain-containing protein [Lachnospiraceae bacterium]|jgi:uncharacterized protein YrzB (UPF0473 family)
MTDNSIVFTNDDGTQEIFYVVEETQLAGVNYLLVSDSDDSSAEAEAYILKDVSGIEDDEALYEYVEDDEEFQALAKVFAELLDEETELI